MKYIIPQTITLETTNVPDEALTEWNSGLAFNTDDIVVVAGDNKVKYMYAGVDGTNTATSPELNPTKWFPTPTNPYSMFDGVVGTQTENAEDITVTFNATNIDTISFFNLEATEITIKMTDNTTLAEVYNETFSLVYDDLADFGDYLFSEQELSDRLVGVVSPETLDLVIASMSEQDILDRFTANPPVYYDSKVEITISNPSSVAKCGDLVVGRKRDLGCTLWSGASTGIMSFSKKVRNTVWGNIELQKGEIADTMSLTVLIDNETVDIVKNRLKAIDGIPCVFIGDETNLFNSLLIYGFFLDFEIPLNPNKTTYTLKIESLI